MMRRAVGSLAFLLLLAGCGTNTGERSASAGLLGIGIGALAGGPVGALIGAGVGAAAGAATPVGVDQVAAKAFGHGNVELSEPQPVSGATLPPVAPQAPQTGSAEMPSDNLAIARVSEDTARRIQEALHAQGLYDGPIDGMLGPQTKAGLVAYRVKRGRPPWPVLDVPTLLDLIGAPGEPGGGPPSTTAQAPAATP